MAEGEIEEMIAGSSSNLIRFSREGWADARSTDVFTQRRISLGQNAVDGRSE